MTGGYLYGADPALRERKVDVSTMLLREVAQRASDGGRTVLSLLRGAESYKNHWGPVPVVNQRLLLARPGLEPLLRLRESQVAVRERGGGDREGPVPGGAGLARAVVAAADDRTLTRRAYAGRRRRRHHL